MINGITSIYASILKTLTFTSVKKWYHGVINFIIPNKLWKIRCDFPQVRFRSTDDLWPMLTCKYDTYLYTAVLSKRLSRKIVSQIVPDSLLLSSLLPPLPSSLVSLFLLFLGFCPCLSPPPPSGMSDGLSRLAMLCAAPHTTSARALTTSGSFLLWPWKVGRERDHSSLVRSRNMTFRWTSEWWKSARSARVGSVSARSTSIR